MRLTTVTYAQHIGRMFKLHWRKQKHQVPILDKAEEVLQSQGITIYEPDAIVEERKVFPRVELIDFVIPKPVPRDSTHPLYKERVCHMYKDHNVLLQGLDQGKVLTKTVEIKEGLPEEIENLIGAQTLSDQDELVRRYIMTSHLLDAMQEKLPKVKDPERPAWVFPRTFGIVDKRRNILLSSKLIQLCEFAIGRTDNHCLIQDELVFVPFEKDGDLIQFELRADFLINSSKPLPSYATPEQVQETKDIQLPNLNPIKHTVTLEKENVYEIRDIFPILPGSKFPHAHTAIIHYEGTEVQNFYGEPVTEEQILGRTLLKAFAIAAANAKQKFGLDVKDLPEPVTVQCIQTDGRLFHFIVLQLNTLNLDGSEGIKNILWTLPRMPLFSTCKYEKGIPTLRDYNEEVFKRFLAFCTNGLKRL